MATDNARDGENGMEPPRLLSRPAGAKPAPAPIHDADELVAARTRWAHIAASSNRPASADDRSHAGAGGADPAQARAPGGVRAKVKARVATAAAGVQAQDRAMTGDLVAALDALASRLDELSERVGDVETLLQELVELTSEELTRVQVALGAARDDPDRDGPDRG